MQRCSSVGGEDREVQCIRGREGEGSEVGRALGSLWKA